ncbi:polysaccharide deacetylase family protein [Paenibacillus sp. HB172176]|uniref:polysaccharide deacetylase family protein n=1 Tax=Paenibacillus sp. HB172176 TaxID=2493690 RepID=UPI001439D1F6|nr:polysaccharide deacetylase family protein [Paenibacillus sp. HB172176]
MKEVLLCYPEGRFKALTMSYDDGRMADKRLIEIWNKHGLKGTCHINSGLLGTKDRIPAEEIASVYEGHEVSAHTVRHPTIARCPNELMVHEVIEDRKALERLTGYTVRGMSYPNGSYNARLKEMLPGLGIEYARVVSTTGGFDLPRDYLEWQATCHHNQKLMEHAERFVDLHKSQYLYLMYVWGHSYEFDNDNNWVLMERFSAFVGGRDDIWYATNIQIVDYLKAYEQLKFSASLDFVYNASALDVWLSVDKAIVKIESGCTVKL